MLRQQFATKPGARSSPNCLSDPAGQMLTLGIPGVSNRALDRSGIESGNRTPDWIDRKPSSCPAPSSILNACAERARDQFTRDANAKRLGFRSNFHIGTLSSVPLPRSDACREKGNHMRTLVKPPPSSRCDLCGGELRLKLIEPASRTLDLENEIFVCASCGHEQSYTVIHDPQTPHTENVSRKA